MSYNVGFTFSVGDTIPRFTISIEQQLEIGDSKFHILCSFLAETKCGLTINSPYIDSLYEN